VTAWHRRNTAAVGDDFAMVHGGRRILALAKESGSDRELQHVPFSSLWPQRGQGVFDLDGDTAILSSDRAFQPFDGPRNASEWKCSEHL